MTDRTIIRNNIAKFVDLTEEEFNYFYDLLVVKDFEKGQYLHTHGSICNKAYFIIRGCIRYFHIVEGEEITGQFFFENAWYSDYESYLFGSPSEQTIQALEHTRAAILTKETMNRLYGDMPKFERFGRLMAENAFLGLRKRTEALTHQSATERYLELLKNRPKVLQRITQRHIASYLNIKPQSLSRIRKKVHHK